LLSSALSTEQNIHIYKFQFNKTVVACILGEHQVVNPREVVFPQAKALRENNHLRVDNFQCLPHMKAIIVYCKLKTVK